MDRILKFCIFAIGFITVWGVLYAGLTFTESHSGMRLLFLMLGSGIGIVIGTWAGWQIFPMKKKAVA